MTVTGWGGRSKICYCSLAHVYYLPCKAECFDQGSSKSNWGGPRLTALVLFGCWTKNRGKTPQNGLVYKWKLLELMIWGYHYSWKHPFCGVDIFERQKSDALDIQANTSWGERCFFWYIFGVQSYLFNRWPWMSRDGNRPLFSAMFEGGRYWTLQEQLNRAVSRSGVDDYAG